MSGIVYSPMFGLLLSVGGFVIGYLLQKKTGFILFNPFIVSAVLSIAVLLLFNISIEAYHLGGNMIRFFLAPATCALALSIYRQRHVLKEAFIPVLLGCLVSAIVSIGGSLILGYLFNLDEVIVASTLASSVTGPIAIDVTNQVSGLVPIAILTVNFAGIFGIVFSAPLVKLLRLTDPVEIGVAIGATSHVLGTSKAMEMGKVEGAMSSVAIGVAGLFTVLLVMFL